MLFLMLSWSCSGDSAPPTDTNFHFENRDFPEEPDREVNLEGLSFLSDILLREDRLQTDRNQNRSR